MHLYVLLVGRVAYEILSSFNIAVVADTYLVSVCSGCTHNYWDFIENPHSKDNMGIDLLRSYGVLLVKFFFLS